MYIKMILIISSAELLTGIEHKNKDILDLAAIMYYRQRPYRLCINSASVSLDFTKLHTGT